MNTTRLSLVLVFCLFYAIGLAQSVLLSGNLTDAQSKKPMAGVSVQVGKQIGTVSNKQGQFNLYVSEALARTHGIRFTYVGYQPAKLAFKDGVFEYNTSLKLLPDSLTNVVVSPKGLRIVKKAIAAINSNYPNQPFMVTGLARTYNVINDTDYFYTNTAVLESRYDRVSKRQAPDTRALQSIDTVVKNPFAKNIASYEQMRWLGAFHLSDFIYGAGGQFNLNTLDKYIFSYGGIEQLNGHTVHRIGFSSRKGTKLEGDIYIDTASLAFVGINKTVYNYRAIGMVPLDVGIYESRFQKIGNNWYPKSYQANAKHVYAQKSQYIVSYNVTAIDTLAEKTFTYSETIQHGDENRTIKKPVPDSAWAAIKPIISQLEQDDKLPVVELPKLTTPNAVKSINDTVVKVPRYNFFQHLNRYMTGPRVNSLFGLQSSTLQPLRGNVNGIQVSDAALVSLNFTARFGTVGQLYVVVHSASNYGIGGTRYACLGRGLSYDFTINKKQRPVTLSPTVLWHSAQFRHRSSKHEASFNSVALGGQMRIEHTRTKAWFLHAFYHHPNRFRPGQLAVQSNMYSFGAGIFLK